MNKLKPLSFFQKRIGKRIYRNDNDCPCHTCQEILKEGLIVDNKLHAQYLFDTQNEYADEGIDLNYRDKLHKN